jgi:2-(1,2-epoxy-1,2-dihydrophenyl)acetyl-CoA isomerase
MKYVSVAFDDAIARIAIDAPPGNRINFQMRRELEEAVDLVTASEARVLLITGAGKAFCLGGDARE